MSCNVDSVLKQLLSNIRSRGWVVAVHNDYRQNGVHHTFWLFTHGSSCVKSEARTDEEALANCLAQITEQNKREK